MFGLRQKIDKVGTETDLFSSVTRAIARGITLAYVMESMERFQTAWQIASGSLHKLMIVAPHPDFSHLPWYLAAIMAFCTGWLLYTVFFALRIAYPKTRGLLIVGCIQCRD